MKRWPALTNFTDRMISGGAADPRGPQTAFLVPVVALVGLLLIFSPSLALHPAFLAGVALIAVATLATFTAPWSRLPPLAIMAVPLLDLAAIGALRVTPEVGAAAALVVFPAMWLGAVFRWRGVLIVTLASFVVLTVPGLAYFGTSLEGWSRALLLPVIAFVTANSMCVTADVWAEQRMELEKQGARLARALDKVTEQRQLGEAILHTVDIGLLGLDESGRYTSMNPRHKELLALSFPDGHAGMSGQLGYVYAADKFTVLEADEMPSVRAARGETFSDYTIWAGKEPADRRALSVSARPILDQDGRFGGAVLAYKDITDLMQALRVKDEFVASVSHELRTPLTSIIGYVDLVGEYDGDLPEEVNRYLRVTRRNAERLLLLVSDLLTAAQAEGGMMRLSLEPTDLAKAVRVSVAAAEPRLQSARLQVDLDLAPVPLMCADSQRFAQVVDNLLSNAVKYTDPGGTVSIDLRQERGDVLLVVSDNGIGISAADQKELFTKFFRARTAEERAIPGVGLGLAITKAIVEGHGGSIEVDSAEGRGTTMRVRLPLSPALAQAAVDTVGQQALAPTVRD